MLIVRLVHCFAARLMIAVTHMTLLIKHTANVEGATGKETLVAPEHDGTIIRMCSRHSEAALATGESPHHHHHALC
jgi:hypothetical protein